MVCLSGLAFTGVKNRESHHIVVLVAHNYIVIGELAVGGKTGLFEINVQYVGFGIVGGPEIFLRRIFDGFDETQIVR